MPYYDSTNLREIHLDDKVRVMGEEGLFTVTALDEDGILQVEDEEGQWMDVACFQVTLVPF